MAYNVKDSNTIIAGQVRKKRKRFAAGWTKNVLKSLGYSAQDVISELMPNTIQIGASAKEASNELRDAFSLAKDKATEGIDFGKRKLQEFKDTEMKEAMEDLRSGKIYNKERIQAKDDASFGDLDFDMDSFDTELDLNDGTSADVKSTNDKTFVDIDLNVGENSPIVQSQDATTAAVMSGSQVLSTTTKESSAALSAAFASLSANLGTKMDLFTSELSKLSTTVPEVLTSQAVLRSEYYEKSLSYQERMVLALEQLNAAYHGTNGLMGIEPSNRYTDPRLKSTLADKTYFDIDQYKDMVKENAKSFVQNSMVGMMVTQVAEMYKMQNDLGAGDNRGILAKGLNAAIKTAIPGAVKGVAKRLDEFVEGLVLPIGMKINEMSNDWASPIKNAIGNIFGIKSAAQTTATKDTYNKGAVAFDGKVHRTIVDVIPTYLRMIASAVTGKEEIAFDYEKGVYNTVSNMKKDYESELRKEAILPQSSHIARFGNSVSKMENLTDAQKESLKNSFEDLMYEMAKDGGFVNFRKNGDRDDIARLLRMSSDDATVKFIRSYFEGLYDEGQHTDLNEIFSSNMLRSRQNIDTINKEMSVDATAHNFHLVNNGLDETQENGVRINNAPGFITDKYGKTSTSYLRDILITLNNGIKVFAIQGGTNNTAVLNSRTMLDRLAADDTALRTRLQSDSNQPTESGELTYDERFSNIVRDYIHEDAPDDRLTEMLDTLSEFFDEDNRIGKDIRNAIEKRRATNRRIYDVGNIISGAGIDLIYGRRAGSVLDNTSGNDASDTPTNQSVEIDGRTYTLGEDGRVYDDNGQVVGKKRRRRLDRTSNNAVSAMTAAAAGNIIRNRLNDESSNNEDGSNSVTDDTPAQKVTAAARKFSEHAENFGLTLRDKVFHPLRTALFDKDTGLIYKMYDAAGAFKKTLIEKVLGVKDENGMYQHGMFSNLANAPKRAMNKAKSWKDALLNGNTDENTPELIMKVREFIGTTDDGKLDIKGKSKGMVADARAYFRNKSYEWTDAIFGKDEDGGHKLDRFKADMKGNGGKIAGAATVGMLSGLFLPGGPIGGAILGAGLEIATKSTQLKDYLFGKEDENGEREDNGLISKEWQERFKKYGKPAGVGAGVGLISSLFLPGGPLLLPVIGAMTGIATKTQAFSEILYGKDGTKDDPTGGLGKYVKDHYGEDKTISDAVKDTGVGAGLGIMGSLFLPGGPLLGAIVGGSASIIRKTDAWAKFMYGDDGTKENPTGGLSKIIKEYYNKDKTVDSAFLDAGIGAGVGILGSFFLPGGPLLGAMMGASTSLILNSEKMQEYLFGPKNENGERQGGFITNMTDKAMNSFYDTADKLSLWLSENVVNPLKVSVKPISERIKRGLGDFKDFIFGDGENSVRNKAKGLIGVLAEQISESSFGGLKRAVDQNIIDPLKRGFKKLFDGFFGMLGSIVKAPVLAIQAIAESSEKKNGGDPKSIQRKINELNEESRKRMQQKKEEREKRRAEKASRSAPPENRTADNTDRIVAAEEEQVIEQKGFFARAIDLLTTIAGEARDKAKNASETVRSAAENISGRRNRRRNRSRNTEDVTVNASEVNPDAILNPDDNVDNDVLDGTNDVTGDNNSTESSTRLSGRIARRRNRRLERARRRQQEAARRATARQIRRNRGTDTESSEESNTDNIDGNSVNPIARLDPDNNIGRNVAKIQRNLDGNINGLGHNVNRIYKLLKRRLGGGAGDDDEYTNQKYYTSMQKAIRFVTAPFRLVGKLTELLYTGTKKAVFGTVKGLYNAGKFLVGGIFDVAKGLAGIPLALVKGVINAVPAVVGSVASIVETAAHGIGTVMDAAGSIISSAATGFGNLISGAFTGLAGILQGLGVLGGEAIKLLAKGGALGISLLAKGGAFIAKGVTGAVGFLWDKMFHRDRNGSERYKRAKEIIISGGKIDSIGVVKLIERVGGVPSNDIPIGAGATGSAITDSIRQDTAHSLVERMRQGGWSEVYYHAVPDSENNTTNNVGEGTVLDAISQSLNNTLSPGQTSVLHVVVDGGYLNYIGGLGGSFSDNVDDDLNIEDEVEEGADTVRGGSGHRLRNRIAKFGETLKQKGDKAIGMARGAASSIFSRFKQEDQEAEEREWRENMLNASREGTEETRKSHFDWSAIFSKKGLITAALIASIPFVIKNFDKITSIAGEAVNLISSMITNIKSGFDKIGGWLGFGNKAAEQINETQALVTGNSEQFVTNDDGTVMLDENGAPVTETIHQESMKDRLKTFFNPKQTVVDEDGKVVLKDDTHVGGFRKKALATVAKRTGKKARKFVTGIGNIKIGNKKIGERVTGFLAKQADNLAMHAETGILAGGSFIRGAAAKIATKVTKTSADDVAEYASRTLGDGNKVSTIIKYCKTAVESLLTKVKPVLKKFKADKLFDKVASTVSKVTSKLFTTGVISGALSKFTKILGKMATAAGTVLTSEVFWAVTGAVSGASRPGELFQVHEDEVDIKMTAISAVFGGLLNTSLGGWIDVIDDLCLEVLGFSFVTWFAVNCVYRVLANDEDEKALDLAREQFSADYEDHVEEVYQAYIKAQQEEGKAYMTREEFKASELSPSWSDYINEQNPTLWQKTKKAFSSPTEFKNAVVGSVSKAPMYKLLKGGKGGRASNSEVAPDMLNGFPYISQNDPNVNTTVSMGDGTKSTLSETGCAPTAMAMVASQVTGRQVNPAMLAEFAAHTGLSTSADGTMPQFINTSSKMLGMNSSLISTSADSLKGTVASGSPIIIQGQSNDSNSPFTPDGHYVVGVGTEGGKILINDPEGKKYSKAYDANVIAQNAQNAWSFSNNPISSMAPTLVNMGNKAKDILKQDKLRSQVVDAIKSRVGKNTYTQSANRTKVGEGYGDCSSTVRWAYMTGANIDPGGYSGAQYTNKLGVDVDNTAGAPDESKLKPGDILFYRRDKSSYTDKVGHVEMYVGDGQRAGHGSGIGPKLTPLSKDGKNYIKARRFITDGATDYDSPELSPVNSATGAGSGGDTSLSQSVVNGSNEMVNSQQNEAATGKGSSLLSILGEWISGIKDKIQENVFGIKPVSDDESTVVNSFGSAAMNMGSTLSNAINPSSYGTENTTTTTASPLGNMSPLVNLANAARGALSSGSDYLGKYTAQFESGGRGPTTISSGKGDKGGVSFGTYQFASYNQPSANPSGPLATFWNNNYASQYPGVVPGNNDAFKQAWVDAASKNPDDFSAREAAYFGNKFYTAQRNKLADTINVDKDRGLQEEVFATSIQYGPNTGVIRDALSGKNAESMNPIDVINTIEDHKINTVGKYFKSSPKIWNGLINRFDNTERKQMTSLSGQKPVQLINTGGKGGRKGMLDSMDKGVVTDSLPSMNESSIGIVNQNMSRSPMEDKYFRDAMSAVVDLLQSIADNTLGIDSGVKSLNAKEPQTIILPNSSSGQTHNTVISPSSNSNNDTDARYYNAAKQISKGVYKRA